MRGRAYQPGRCLTRVRGEDSSAGAHLCRFCAARTRRSTRAAGTPLSSLREFSTGGKLGHEAAGAARLVAEPGGKAFVVGLVVVGQCRAQAGRHGSAGTGVLTGELGVAALGDAKEGEDLVVDGLGGGEELGAVDDVDGLRGRRRVRGARAGRRSGRGCGRRAASGPG